MKNLILILCVLGVAGPAAADMNWGGFRDDGCVDPSTRPGLRQYAARLWDIPAGTTWEAACAKAGATLGGYVFPHPAVCVNALQFMKQQPCLDVSNGLQECHKMATGAAILSQALVDWPYGKTIRHATRPALLGHVPASKRNAWKAEINARIAQRGAFQVKEGNGGSSMWGIFLVADDRCLPPDYARKGGPGASWMSAVVECQNHGQRLCLREELCTGGKPDMGTLPGDVWVAVGDGAEEWLSLGQKWPDRMCRTHTEVIGKTPDWSTVGPETVTGQPTAWRCCDCSSGCNVRP
ncbi:MAG: hypothetical protein KC620_20745 [Myxococcales bacterium]|nr:hypothetical protein [Myxococcales bacterium]